MTFIAASVAILIAIAGCVLLAVGLTFNLGLIALAGLISVLVGGFAAVLIGDRY